MKENKSYLNNVKSDIQPNQKFIELKNNNFQQKLLTTTTDKSVTDIVDIKEAEKVATREENY